MCRTDDRTSTVTEGQPFYVEGYGNMSDRHTEIVWLPHPHFPLTHGSMTYKEGLKNVNRKRWSYRKGVIYNTEIGSVPTLLRITSRLSGFALTPRMVVDVSGCTLPFVTCENLWCLWTPNKQWYLFDGSCKTRDYTLVTFIKVSFRNKLIFNYCFWTTLLRTTKEMYVQRYNRLHK